MQTQRQSETGHRRLPRVTTPRIANVTHALVRAQLVPRAEKCRPRRGRQNQFGDPKGARRRWRYPGKREDEKQGNEQHQPGRGGVEETPPAYQRDEENDPDADRPNRSGQSDDINAIDKLGPPGSCEITRMGIIPARIPRTVALAPRDLRRAPSDYRALVETTAFSAENQYIGASSPGIPAGGRLPSKGSRVFSWGLRCSPGIIRVHPGWWRWSPSGVVALYCVPARWNAPRESATACCVAGPWFNVSALECEIVSRL